MRERGFTRTLVFGDVYHEASKFLIISDNGFLKPLIIINNILLINNKRDIIIYYLRTLFY